MEFSFDARLPEDYIDEISLRMEIYHRLGEATSPEEVDAILSELKDRFGPPLPSLMALPSHPHPRRRTKKRFHTP